MIDDEKLPLELVWEPAEQAGVGAEPGSDHDAHDGAPSGALSGAPSGAQCGTGGTGGTGGGGRHLSEIVLTAIADGQLSIIPNVALVHLQSCETCVCAIGNAAMLSARISAHLNELAPSASNQAAAHAPANGTQAAAQAAQLEQPAEPIRLPWAAIAAALLVAGLAALPSITSAPVWFEESSRVMLRAIPQLLHGVITVVRSGTAVPVAISYASAALLMLIGVTIAMRQNPASPDGSTGR
ncbi:hypothetical protein [Pendulispora albinea]|uniref:Zinc-finger domain-containing protein n=1 Tax=Pendulispora albinea TaxID=2741071 RepID=A0ABZ2LYF6_9BACT